MIDPVSGETIPGPATEGAEKAAPVPSARTMIVSGLPRSGTSLLMGMLQAGGIPLLTDSQRSADISNPHGYFEYEPVKRLAADNTWLRATAGQAVKIVIPLVRRLPSDFQCDILLLERDLPEVLASQAAMLELAGIASADPGILAPAFEREWNLTRETLSALPGCRVLIVRHRDLLDRPLEISGEIAGFLRLPLNLPAMAATVYPALHRQRSPGILLKG